MLQCSSADPVPGFFRGLYFALTGYFLKYKTSFKLRKQKSFL